MAAKTFQASSPAEAVRLKLAHLLGPFTAMNAIQLGAKQVGADPDRLTRAQLPALLDAIGPTLRTLLGKTTAEKIADELRTEFTP